MVKARENNGVVGVVMDLFIILLWVITFGAVVVLMLRELRRVADGVDLVFCCFFAVVLFLFGCVVLR